MFFMKFRSQLRMELEEMKHQHRLEIEAARAELAREKRHWAEDKSREIAQLKKEHELALKETVTLKKLEAEQGVKKAELDAQAKINTEVSRMQQDFYEKLSAAMSKLHEEGNVTTRFMQDIAVKMMGNQPVHKTETKVITSGE